MASNIKIDLRETDNNNIRAQDSYDIEETDKFNDLDIS
jgi:hypothetical protein